MDENLYTKSYNSNSDSDKSTCNRSTHNNSISCINKNNDKRRKKGKKPISDKVADRLDDLTEYAAQQMSNNEIANLLGISRSSFYKLLSENTEFKEAYKRGLQNRKYELEKALLKRAEGFTIEEKQIIQDSDGNIIKQTITEKNYVPDTTALIFALKNIYGEKYRDKIEQVNTFNVNIKQIQNLSDEELLKLAGSIDIPIDFEVE